MAWQDIAFVDLDEKDEKIREMFGVSEYGPSYYLADFVIEYLDNVRNGEPQLSLSQIVGLSKETPLFYKHRGIIRLTNFYQARLGCRFDTNGAIEIFDSFLIGSCFCLGSSRIVSDGHWIPCPLCG